MVAAVLEQSGGAATATTFSVAPSGIENGDFSFIVIGDTGEGDASQHVLRDQLLSVAGRDDVRFVVVSSDVIGNSHSSIFDPAFTSVTGGKYLKCLSWYDNEWGYSNRVCDLLGLLARWG